MLHVFVDTNVLLSLYAYTDDNIEELKKFVELIKANQLKIYIPSIVNQEFYRNRDKKIAESLGNLEKFSVSLSLPRFVEHHPEAQQLRELLKTVGTKRGELVEKAKAPSEFQVVATDSCGNCDTVYAVRRYYSRRSTTNVCCAHKQPRDKRDLWRY